MDEYKGLSRQKEGNFFIRVIKRLEMTTKIDIMLYGEIYYHTLKYESKSPFPPSKEELREFTIQKLPSLRNKHFEVFVYPSKEKESAKWK